MWETNSEGGCPRVYEVLGLLGRQAGGGGRVPVWPPAGPCLPASTSRPAVLREGAVRFRSGLYPDHAAVFIDGGGSRLGGPLGPSLSLPDLLAPPADADLNRRLDAYSAEPTPHRVYLPVWPRDAQGGRSANHRPPGTGLAAARRHVERTGFAGRHQKVSAEHQGRRIRAES